MESKNQSKRDTTKTMPMVSQSLDCAMILGARSRLETEETRLLLTTFASDLIRGWWDFREWSLYVRSQNIRWR